LAKEKIILNKTNAQLKKEQTDALVAKIAHKHPSKGKCEGCGTMYHKRGMLFHHLEYRKEEKDHKDFPGDRLGYYLYLEPIIKKRPKKFLYLCTPCHGYVSKLRRIKDNKRIKKLGEAAIKTQFIPPRGRRSG